MLPPFIIEQIRQREEKERQKRQEDRPRLELPLERSNRRRPGSEQPPQDEDDKNRGVVIVDLR